MLTRFARGGGGSPGPNLAALVLRPGGKILAAGRGSCLTDPMTGASEVASALVRYEADDTPDGSFGEEGRVFSEVGGEANVLAAQRASKTVVAGGTPFRDDSDFVLARYLAR
jgi:hypothetical protein